jgi:hypothetical protein
MASDHKQPLSVNKRVRFYDGQFLQDQDLIDEQKYHIGQLSRHRRSLHVAGVVEGLEVTARFADDDEPAAPGAGSSPREHDLGSRPRH